VVEIATLVEVVGKVEVELVVTESRVAIVDVATTIFVVEIATLVEVVARVEVELVVTNP